MNRTPGTGGLLAPRKWKNKAGNVITGKYWRLWYVDASGRQCRLKGFTDKQASQEELSKRLKTVAMEIAGLAVPNSHILRKPLLELLEQFIEDKAADGNSTAELKKKRTRLLKLFRETGATVYGDVKEVPIKSFLLAKMRSGTLAKKTRNEYRGLAKQFTAWVSRLYHLPDPLQVLLRERGQDGLTFERFALNKEQLEKLFNAARERGKVKYLATHPSARPETLEQLELRGLEREMIYRLGAMMGLRINEIRTLTWGCFSPRDEYVVCTIEARYAKSRRKDTVPISPGLLAALEIWHGVLSGQSKTNLGSGDLVVKVPRHINEQFRKDCEFADIPTTNGNGHVLDLYAATRHTFCTLLGRASVAPHVQRMLMRHRDLGTTLKYTHLDTVDLVPGVNALPTFSSIPKAHVNHMLTGGRILAHYPAHKSTNENGSEVFLKEDDSVVELIGSVGNARECLS
jgi:integrase/recombinase XerC